MLVEKQFAGWEVDCDYDRLGERTMRLPHGSVSSTDDHLGKSIYPDIVVHQRDIPNNLLAIEVRKASNHQPIEHDQHKLKALTDPHLWFAFSIGVFVTLAKKNVTFIGGLCRRHHRAADLGVVRRAAEGSGAGGLMRTSHRAAA